MCLSLGFDQDPLEFFTLLGLLVVLSAQSLFRFEFVVLHSQSLELLLFLPTLLFLLLQLHKDLLPLRFLFLHFFLLGEAAHVQLLLVLCDLLQLRTIPLLLEFALPFSLFIHLKHDSVQLLLLLRLCKLLGLFVFNKFLHLLVNLCLLLRV